jgi:hypothetical protein
MAELKYPMNHAAKINQEITMILAIFKAKFMKGIMISFSNKIRKCVQLERFKLNRYTLPHT